MTVSSEVKKKVKEEDSKKEEVKAGVGKNKKDEIIKAIGQMNVLELSNLVKELREEFGIEALAIPTVVQASGAPEKEEEEKTEFDVILSEIGSKKIQVIKEVRKLTSLGLKEAKDLVEQAPKPVREKILKEEALKIKETLEAVGAKVEIK